ncbi:MAG: hypothetical protein AAFX55_19970, partial [Bacteroidota bacterium]
TSINSLINTSVLGFYPEEDNIYPVFNEESVAVLGEDGGDPYSTSLSINVTPSQLQQILNAAINFENTYHLDDYNCTDFAIELGNQAGLGLPDCSASWPGGGGSNPGTLGVEIRDRTLQPGETRDIIGGLAPESHKGC